MELALSERPMFWNIYMWPIIFDEHAWGHFGRAARLRGQWLVGAHQVNWGQI